MCHKHSNDTRLNMENSTSFNRIKPTTVCPHGKECQRKIPHHFMEYSHEHLDKIIEQNATARRLVDYQIPDDFLADKDLILDQIKIIDDLFGKKLAQPNAKRFKLDASMAQPMTVAQKLAAASPYNFFLTRVQSSPQTHNDPLSITFQEILDPSLGDLESSVQINFVVQPDWLFDQYISVGHLDKPLLILYGRERSLDLEEMSLGLWPKLTTHFIAMPLYSTHHTKMMLLGYKDGSMRVVVSTANLYEPDWRDRAQGLWISDRLDAIPNGASGDSASGTAAGDSETGFQNDLVTYLTAYNLPQLTPWIQRIRNTNFKSVNVFLITSVPGTHANINGHAHGHGRVGHLLSQHSAQIDESTPVVAQCSAIGNFGTSVNEWLTTDIVNSFRRHLHSDGLNEAPGIRIIYPSLSNVQNCYGGVHGADCLPYSHLAHQNQLWLTDLLYQWRADCRHRSKAVPHIKTYCRWSEKKLFWFMLTSANLSKAAWGKLSRSRNNPSLYINNYEAGVLFLPKFVIKTQGEKDNDYFPMDDSNPDTPKFPPVYDIPLTIYGLGDQPFLN